MARQLMLIGLSAALSIARGARVMKHRTGAPRSEQFIRSVQGGAMSGAEFPENKAMDMFKGFPPGGVKFFTAASSNPEGSVTSSRNWLASVGIPDAEWIPVHGSNCAQRAQDPQYVQMVEEANAIYMFGGQSGRLSSCLFGNYSQSGINSGVETPLLRALLAKSIVGGSSAGAMNQPMSEILITGHSVESYSAVRNGYVFQRDSGNNCLGAAQAVDTHFSERGRQGRLLVFAMQTQAEWAFGVDEQSSYVWSPSGEYEMIGAGPSPTPTPTPPSPPSPAPTPPAPTPPAPTPPAPTPPAPTPPAPTPPGSCSSWCEPPADCTAYPFSCSGCCSGSPTPTPSPPAPTPPSPPPSGSCLSICDRESDCTNYPSICAGCSFCGSLPSQKSAYRGGLVIFRGTTGTAQSQQTTMHYLTHGDKINIHTGQVTYSADKTVCAQGAAPAGSNSIFDSWGSNIYKSVSIATAKAPTGTKVFNYHGSPAVQVVFTKQETTVAMCAPSGDVSFENLLVEQSSSASANFENAEKPNIPLDYIYLED